MKKGVEGRIDALKALQSNGLGKMRLRVSNPHMIELRGGTCTLLNLGR